MATAAALAHAHPVGSVGGEEPLRIWLSRVMPEDFREPGGETPDRAFDQQ